MEGLSRTGVIRLFDLMSAVVAGRDPVEILERTLDSAIELLNADRGFVVVPNGPARLDIRVARDLGRKTVAGQHAQVSKALVAHALAEGQSVLVEAPLTDPRFSESQSLKAGWIRSALASPLAANGKIHGAIVLHEKARAAPFNEADRHLLDRIGVHAAHPLELLLAKATAEAKLAAIETLLAQRRYKRLVGNSAVMHVLFGKLANVCASEAPVLILGETGTGKELLARTIHEEGPRAGEPFVGFNVTEVPESLIASGASSATSREPTPEPTPRRGGSSARRTAARSSSTRSAT